MEDELIGTISVEIARRACNLGRYWINKSVADVLIARPVRKLRAGFGF